MMSVKELVQAGFNAFGLHVSYNRNYNRSGWDFFF